MPRLLVGGYVVLSCYKTEMQLVSMFQAQTYGSRGPVHVYSQEAQYIQDNLANEPIRLLPPNFLLCSKILYYIHRTFLLDPCIESYSCNRFGQRMCTN